MGMAAGASEHQIQIEKAENVIQYVLAVVAPSLMAFMLYSFLLFDFLFTATFFAIVLVALLTLLPAMKMHRLHFKTWARNTMPQKLVTSVIGMIYIAVVSVLVISLLSAYEGLDPEKPATFAISGGLLLALLGVMTFDARNKERFACTEKRFFFCTPATLEEHLVKDLLDGGHEHRRAPRRKGSHVELPSSGLRVRILPLNRGQSEVLVENINDKNADMAARLKTFLDDVA